MLSMLRQAAFEENEMQTVMGQTAQAVVPTPSYPAPPDVAINEPTPEVAALMAQGYSQGQAAGVLEENALTAQYAALVKANPQSIKTPQAGTVPVASSSSLAQSIANALAAGGNAYTQMQIQSALNQAKATGQPIYAPHSAVTAKSSSSTWLYAGGVAGLIGLGLIAYLVLRKK